MITLLIIGASIAWVLFGFQIFIWIINWTDKIFGSKNLPRKLRFRDWFVIPEHEDRAFYVVALLLSLIWPFILLLAIEAWRNEARKIREEARYE